MFLGLVTKPAVGAVEAVALHEVNAGATAKCRMPSTSYVGLATWAMSQGGLQASYRGATFVHS